MAHLLARALQGVASRITDLLSRGLLRVGLDGAGSIISLALDLVTSLVEGAFLRIWRDSIFHLRRLVSRFTCRGFFGRHVRNNGRTARRFRLLVTYLVCEALTAGVSHDS